MKRTKIVLIFLTAVLVVSVTGVVSAQTGEYYSALMAPKPAVCTITNPSDGATVSGTVTITVSATRRPYIYIDGVQVAKATSFSWDTTAYSNGLHDIEAVIRGASDLITVTVDNGGGGDDPPVVTIVSPNNGATVSGSVTIMTTVTDEEVLTSDIYIDSQFIVTASSYSWDTTAYSDGIHTIYAEATDSASQTGNDQVSVTVDNSGPVANDLPWWNDLIDAEIAHANGITGDGSIVVIIDTGLGTNWGSLFPATNILTDYCMSQTKSLGLDNVEWNQDTEGHGTACTATVIGYDLNGDWVRGVATDAKIVMIRTVYWIGGGVTDTTMLNAWADAIDYARGLHNGALSSYDMVISMSLGYTGTNTNLATAIAAAEAAGIVLATSAGNDGHVSDTTGYPAEYADVTSVAAAGWDSLTGTYGIDGLFTDIPEGDFSQLHIADFSSGGKVDVTGIGEQMILPYTDGYYYTSGTSFSCPQTAGVYALMFQAWGSMSVQWLEDYLKSTCYWNGAYMTSFVWGAGFIQADAATS